MMRLRMIQRAFWGLSLLLTTLAQLSIGAEDAETTFTLKSDRYMLTFDATYGDQAAEKTESTIVEVTVTDDGAVKIVKKEQTIEGRLEKNNFTASIQKGNGTLQLSGELTANNKLSGNISGTASDGKTTVKGSFKLKHLPRQPGR